MIKAQACAPDGAKLVLLGLSRRNMELLLEGKPIAVDLKLFGLGEGEIVIVGGETEAAIAETLKEFIGPDTKNYFEGEQEQPA